MARIFSRLSRCVQASFCSCSEICTFDNTLVILGPPLILTFLVLITTGLYFWFYLMGSQNISILLGIYFGYCIYFHYFAAALIGPGYPDIQSDLPTQRRCKKCGNRKPERTHHCSACNRCILKFDHHCPWLGNCVGHKNHRYFYLFLAYTSLACIIFAIGTSFAVYRSFILNDPSSITWPSFSSNSHVLFLFIYLCAVLLGAALVGMTIWHTYLIGTSQTTVEYSINLDRKDEAKQRGLVFRNEYDLGFKRNFIEFFGISRERGWYTIFIPITYPLSPDNLNGERFLTTDDLFKE